MLGVRATVTWWWQLMADVIGAVHTHVAAQRRVGLEAIDIRSSNVEAF
jgi:hypothetical protein